MQVAQGDLAAALKSYSDSLAISERLAKSDPGNAGWQRDLSVSYEKVGDVQVAQGDLAGGAEILSATASPSASAWRNPIPATPAGSAICRCPTTRSATCWWRRAISPAALKSYPRQPRHQRAPGQGRPRQRRLAARSVGVLREDRRRAGGAGRSRAALQSYSDSLAIRERLAKSDPGNAGWQRDLSVTYGKLAAAYRISNEAEKARDASATGRAIIAKLVEQNPGLVQWKKVLAWFDGQLAELERRAPPLKQELPAPRNKKKRR